MPSNERANQRKEKQLKKEKRIKAIVWVVLLVILASLVVMKVFEIDFSDLKSKILSETSLSDSAYPCNLDLSSDAMVSVVNDKLAILSETSVSVINPSSGDKKYSFDHGYTNPCIETSGNYICTYDQGGTRIRLDTTTGDVFEKTTDKNIISAALSKNGTIAYSVFDDEVKSKIIVLTKNESKKMELDVNSGYVTSIALNPSGSKCIYTTISSNDADLITTVHTINVGDNEDEKTFDIINSNVLKVEYSSSNKAYIIGNDFIALIKFQDELDYIFEQGSLKIINYCFTDDKELVLNYSDYSNSTESTVCYINSNGTIKSEFDTKEIPKYISSNTNEITVLYSNSFSTYSLTKGEIKDTISCDSSIVSVHTLSSKHYVHYGQFIDVID